MFSLLLLLICSFALSFVLTPLCRNAATARGAVDCPDESRKFHLASVPRLGGIPIFVAFGLSYGVLLLAKFNGAEMITRSLPFAFSLLPAMGVVFLVGLADDLVGLNPRQKIAGELVAAGLACWSGVLIHGIGGHAVFGWWGYPITMLWLIACTNAFNLIDGIDGLASGVGLFAAVTTFLSALLLGDYGLQLATIPLIGALFAFLLYNFSPASIFLGDCGSLTIGFLLGCCGVVWSQKAPTILGMTAPLIALSIPLLDTGLAVVRRFLRGQSIFAPDRRHIHHRLLDLGLTPRRVALLLYGVCGIAAAFALVQSVARGRVAGLVIVVFCVISWVGVHRLGYIEFALAARLARPRMFCRILNAQLRLHTLEGVLERAATADDCWTAIQDAAQGFGFSQVSMCLNHTVFGERHEGSMVDTWVLFVPLSSEEFVELACSSDSPIEPFVVAPFADLLRYTLTSKIPMFKSARYSPEFAIAGRTPAQPDDVLQKAAGEAVA